jgi:tetratricopeptide (TPR) repeat protein
MSGSRAHGGRAALFRSQENNASDALSDPKLHEYTKSIRYGESLIEEGRLDIAIDTLTNIIDDLERNPITGLAPPYYQRARAHYAKAAFEDAIKDAELHLDVGGRSVEGLCLLGRIHDRLHQYRQSLNYYHAALFLRPRDPAVSGLIQAAEERLLRQTSYVSLMEKYKIAEEAKMRPENGTASLVMGQMGEGLVRHAHIYIALYGSFMNKVYSNVHSYKTC